MTSIILPDGLEYISNDAFRYCEHLTAVEIPDSVTMIDSYAFENCAGLKDVYYTGSEAQWYSISGIVWEYSLRDAKIHFNSHSPVLQRLRDTSAVIASGKSGENVQWEIHESGVLYFYGCGSIEKYYDTSYRYSEFNSVIIEPGITSIGNYAFGSCTSLKSIEIPKSVTMIQYSAFDGCTGLKDVYYTGSEDQWSEVEYYSPGFWIIMNP